MAGCDGPNGSKWQGDSCTATSAQTSCDEMAGTTCYYAILQFMQFMDRYATQEQPFEFMGGVFVEGDSGPFRVTCPGSLIDIGIVEGTIIDTLNGRKITPKSIMKWTPERPCRVADFTCRSDGTKHLKLAA